MAPAMTASSFSSGRPTFPLQLSPRALKASFSQTEVLSPKALAKQEKDLCLPAQDNLYINKSDQQFWAIRCAESLDSLMKAAGSYTPAQRAAHLRLLSELVIPSLGPHPTNAPTKPLLTANGSPFEPSWNITDSGSSSIRFSFEPLGRHGGTPSDPFAQKMIPALLPALQMFGHGVDTRWFEQFASALFLDEFETKVALEKLGPDHRAPTAFLAFDLDGAKAVFKTYFFPVLKHIATGASTESITFNAIRSLSPGGDRLAPAVNATEEYFKNAPFPIPVEMIALDCIDPAAGARAKVYARTQSNAFDVVRQVVTLGGQVKDETTLEGLEAMRSIWHLLHNEAEPYADDFNKQPKVMETLHKGICYGFELKPGSQWPEVKSYVPLWQYADNDAVIAANLAKAFKSRGWPVAERYETDLPKCFPRSDLNRATGTHSYISFAFSKKKGAYLTMYYSIKPSDSIVAF
ncbi:tryptophan dimethylallyltransferase [Colletotrichum karsti]|uniref:Tryptophan dimethylallyltransferase n=1 Tax=Colletotrichum karsti TaxID=1095194 RepID=A0A9P6HW75_9PEZI|nr:tryptophan dimethylallyltransferase [Colletotrichum karsti]KAF9871509.1 tryptophan dimethylallyltransferase [Colletotrichum karsti]